MDLQEEPKFAVDIANQGGKAIREALAKESGSTTFRWSASRLTEVKTGIDQEVDELLRTRIHDAFPNDSIWSEESDAVKGNSGRLWVLDPIDGTLNLQGPMFGLLGVCIALVDEETGIPKMGVILSPNLKVGSAGGRIWVGGEGYTTGYNPYYSPGVQFSLEKAHVSDCTVRNQAVGAFDGGKKNRTAVIPYLEKLWADDGISALCAAFSASMALASVAIGTSQRGLDFYGATSLDPEDMAAAVPIIRGAGGIVTTIDGRPWTIKEPSILAANPTLHKNLLEYLNT